MSISLFANNIQTTLASNITSLQTSITLVSTSGLPNPVAGQYFVMTFTNGATNEVVWVTNVTGSVITCIRGQEGTSAQTFVAGSYASCFPTAGTMQNLIQIDQLQNGSYTFTNGSGTANALTATITSNLTTITNGFQFVLNAANANTGSATLNLTLNPTISGASPVSTGALPIYRNGTLALTGGEITGANYLCLFTYNANYNGSAGAFVLENPYNPVTGVVSINQVQDQYFTYSSSGGTTDALTVTLPAGLSALTDGCVVVFRNTVSSNTTTTPTLNVTYGSTATGATVIKKYNNLPLSAGDTGGTGYICQLVYSSSNSAWMLLNPAPGVAGGVTSLNSGNSGIGLSGYSGSGGYTGAVTVYNQGVLTVNGSTGISGTGNVIVTPASISAGGLSTANTWLQPNTFNGGIIIPTNYGVSWGTPSTQGIGVASSSGNLDINFSTYTSIYGGQFTGIGFSVSSTAINEVLRLNSNEIITGNIYPVRCTYDAGTTLGTASYRWSVVYAATGTINTSDSRGKTDIAESDLGLDFINSLKPVKYKTTISGNMVDSNEVDELGQPIKIHTEGKRTHYGLIAQDVKKVLNKKDFAGWTLADSNDPDSLQGLRYAEFIAPLIKAVQELNAKQIALENTINIQASYIAALQAKV